MDVKIPGGPYLHDPSLYTIIFTLYVESNSLEAELYMSISGFQILHQCVKMKIMFKSTSQMKYKVKNYIEWAQIVKNKYLLVRRNPNARDILMIFLQIKRNYVLCIEMFHI